MKISAAGAQSTKLSPQDLTLRTSHRETNKQQFEKGLPLFGVRAGGVQTKVFVLFF